MIFVVQVCAVKAPGFGENRKSSLHDLAILTGGEVSSIIQLKHEFSIFLVHVLANFVAQLLMVCILL